MLRKIDANARSGMVETAVKAACNSMLFPHALGVRECCHEHAADNGIKEGQSIRRNALIHELYLCLVS